MIKLKTSLIWPGCAQGKYIVKAKGFILAMLRWGNSNAPLDGWDPFAYVPIDPYGNGIFNFTGRRGIPQKATHVWARCYASDFSAYKDTSVELLQKFKSDTTIFDDSYCFSILTDLHLSSKSGKIKRALGSTESNIILLLGDSTNDGLPEQFSDFKACIEEMVPHKTIFSVTGNHDVLHNSRGDKDNSCKNYASFQDYLLQRAEDNGHNITYDINSKAYSIQIGCIDLIGLQCVSTGRQFVFHELQIDWLEEYLSSSSSSWHIIFCHAPLLDHNPRRSEGTPYLDMNMRLQRIIDNIGRVIFFSGHTHVSPNTIIGNGEYDQKHKNIYLDCGSVVATDTTGQSEIMSPNWKDGCKTELIVTKDAVEIIMSSIESGTIFPRGYYRFII